MGRHASSSQRATRCRSSNVSSAMAMATGSSRSSVTRSRQRRPRTPAGIRRSRARVVRDQRARALPRGRTPRASRALRVTVVPPVAGPHRLSELVDVEGSQERPGGRHHKLQAMPLPAEVARLVEDDPDRGLVESDAVHEIEDDVAIYLVKRRYERRTVVEDMLALDRGQRDWPSGVAQAAPDTNVGGARALFHEIHLPSRLGSKPAASGAADAVCWRRVVRRSRCSGWSSPRRLPRPAARRGRRGRCRARRTRAGGSRGERALRPRR